MNNPYVSVLLERAKLLREGAEKTNNYYDKVCLFRIAAQLDYVALNIFPYLSPQEGDHGS